MIYKSFQLEQNINSTNKKFVLFFGENLGLKNDFKNKIRANNKTSEIIILNQEEIIKNNKILINEINNLSLFEKKKIFFINDANDKILETIKLISDNKSENKIYLFSEILEKKSKLRTFFEKEEFCVAVPCYADNEITLKRIVNERLKGFKGLNTYNINLILNNCFLDRMKLLNELEKIVIYFQNKNIETKQLESLLNIKVNEDFNALKDEALKGNKNKTNELLGQTILEEDKNIYYLNQINQRLNRLNEVQGVKDLELAINNMKPPIFWKDKPSFLLQAKKWDREKIQKIRDKTLDIEIKIKSNSNFDKKILFKNLIVNICEVANS